MSASVIIYMSSAWPTVVVGVVRVIGTLGAAIGAVLLAQRSENPRWNAVGAENVIRSPQAASLYSWMTPPSLSVLRSRARSGLPIEAGFVLP
jgi:hypothetical protein